MRLKIENFAKIAYADLNLDGITVIAGMNNSGKSTIGKILYSTFNSLYNIDEKIDEQRMMEIVQILDISSDNILQLKRLNLFKEEKKVNTWTRGEKNRFLAYMQMILSKEKKETFDVEKYQCLLNDAIEMNDISIQKEAIKDFVDETYDKISMRVTNLDNISISKEIIQRFFRNVFGSQIKCLGIEKDESNIRLNLKGKEIKIGFKDNECVAFDSDINILHEAFFIDDPFIIDDLQDIWWGDASKSDIRSSLLSRIAAPQDNIMEGLFEAVSAKENLKEIYDVLDSVVVGTINSKKNRWTLECDYCKEPIYLKNLSAGMKSFLELRLLLERGILKEKDILILDEPEIHLHPEWQLVYAELIVLLQKKFDLTIVVTTHSRDFLESIELYSRKHEIDSKCNYYLANVKNNLASFEDVTENIDKIYRQLVTPGMLLDRLRYDLDSRGDNE